METRDNQFEYCLQQFLDQQVIRFVIDGKNSSCVFFTVTDLDAQLTRKSSDFCHHLG